MLCTSEQVSAGHPDKICDQISDAIVTDCLRHDKNSRVAAECLIKDYEIIIAGEITSAHRPDFKALARGVLRRIGLPGVDQYRVTALISQQSPDIALGVDADGAGDQGMMFGYATDETPQMLPIPYVLACDALERLAGLKSPLLLPDAKCQVTYEAIIPEATFERVQLLLAGRTAGQNRLSSVNIFSSKIKCGCCGGWYGSKVWHSNDKYRRVIWQCNHKFDGEKCSTPTLSEDEIKAIFLRAANQVIDARDDINAMYREVLLPRLSTETLQDELRGLESEITVTAGLIEECIRENAHIALDQAEYQKRYEALSARYDAAKARQEELTQEISARQARRQQIELFLTGLQAHETLTVFRDEDWLAMVDHLTVRSATDVTMTFKDGTEIRA